MEREPENFFCFSGFCTFVVGWLLSWVSMELRERIIERALVMFYDMGIKSVRMDDIAVACGISKRTLYENFADREDLVRQTVKYYLNTICARLAEQMSHARNVIDEFRIACEHGADFRTSARKVVLDLMKFYPKIFDDVIRSYYDAVVKTSDMRMRRGIETGLFLGCIDTEFMARNFVRYLYGLHQDLSDVDISAQMGNEDKGPVRMHMAVMLFLRGISTEAGRRYIDENILPDIANKTTL